MTHREATTLAQDIKDVHSVCVFVGGYGQHTIPSANYQVFVNTPIGTSDERVDDLAQNIRWFSDRNDIVVTRYGNDRLGSEITCG
jgi:hypothetical protein